MKFLVVSKKRLWLCLVTSLCLVALLVSVGLTGSAAVYGNKTTRKLPIYGVNTTEKVVALSFDACWGADKTQKILDTLTKYDVKANFFVVGFWAEKYPDALKKLADSGRVEIGTHSNTHPHLPRLAPSQMELELSSSAKTIEKLTNKKVELFRPPYGDYSDSLLNVAEKEGLYTIQWDVDSLDWKGLSALEITSRVLKSVKNGSIVLMHNDGKNTAEALPAIIQGLKNKGYAIKPISEIIFRDNFTIDHEGRQTRR